MNSSRCRHPLLPTNPLPSSRRLSLMNHRQCHYRLRPWKPLRMALPNGLADRSPKGLLGLILSRNLMGPYVARRVIRSGCMSVGLSALARYAWETRARIVDCRPCPLRAQCQETTTTRKPRQVSAVVWPIPSVAALPPSHPVAPPFECERIPPPLVPAPLLAPVLWGDWPRCQFRRRWIRLLRTQTVELTFCALAPETNLFFSSDEVQTRAQRAHYRLSWQQRMARNTRLASAPQLEITISGLPASFALYVGIGLVTVA